MASKSYGLRPSSNKGIDGVQMGCLKALRQVSSLVALFRVFRRDAYCRCSDFSCAT